MSHTDWHPADIIAAIRKQELTLTELALLNGLPHRACQTAMFCQIALVHLSKSGQFDPIML